MHANNLHPVLVKLKTIIPDLTSAIGQDCEIVLHDISHPESSIIAIAGNITGRQKGGPLTDLLLKRLRAGDVDENLMNYMNYTKDGKLLRSSTIFIRDDNEKVIGCLCINIDLSRWLSIQKFLDDHLAFTDSAKEEKETFSSNVKDMLRTMVSDAILGAGIPVGQMHKDDRKRVLAKLDREGVFLVKGAIEYVAGELQVSKFTIYSDLNEIHAQARFDS